MGITHVSVFFLLDCVQYKRMLRVLSLLSLVSAALNTPVTIYSACWLNLTILGVDIFLAAVFTWNMLMKMRYRGIFKVSYFLSMSYLQFNLSVSFYTPFQLPLSLKLITLVLHIGASFGILGSTCTYYNVLDAEKQVQPN